MLQRPSAFTSSMQAAGSGIAGGPDPYPAGRRSCGGQGACRWSGVPAAQLSWALRLGMPVPWQAASATANVVFSTYLDQSIMFATTASVLWHLRKEGLWPVWLGTLMALLALANSLLVLEGRSGYLVALSAIALAAMWAMPTKWRLPRLVATRSSHWRHWRWAPPRCRSVSPRSLPRASICANQQSRRGGFFGLAAQCLEAVHPSLSQKPLLGHGVGNWTPAVKQFEGANAVKNRRYVW